MPAPSKARQVPADPGRASLEDTQDGNAHNSDPIEADRPYPCGRWHWLNPTTGEVREYLCGSWRCGKCTPAKVSRWTKVLGQAPIRRHIVLTALGFDPLVARTNLNHIHQAIRRGELGRRPREPWQHEYFCALESHSAAGYHAHLLQWGRYLPQRSLSRLCARYGAGTVCWARAYDPDPAAGQLRRYVVRHLIATLHPRQHKPGRRIRYSRNFWDGRSARQVADELWPKANTGPWQLMKPDLDRAAGQRELADEAKHEFYHERMEDFWLRVLPEAELLRRGIIRPYFDSPPDVLQ